MRKKSTKLTFLSWLLLFIFSCITINIYFPEAAVKKTAEEIVDEVRKTDEDEKDKKKEEVMFSSLVSFSFVPAAYAQEETKVTTPKIRALKQSLRERFPKLRPFYAGGNIGEANDGFIRVRNESGLDLKGKSLLRRLVKNENEDRRALYAEVARAMDIDLSQIPRIKKIFAKNWIRKARPGWWIQRESGQWIRKPGGSSPLI